MLNAGSAVMPPLPKYESFPCAAAIGEVSPLKLDLVFDDRYFMASNELNLLNTLLLANEDGMLDGWRTGEGSEIFEPPTSDLWRLSLWPAAVNGLATVQSMVVGVGLNLSSFSRSERAFSS